jgi:hypothetical protein
LNQALHGGLAQAGCPTWKSERNFSSKVHRAKRVKRLDILLKIGTSCRTRKIRVFLPTLHAFCEEVIVHLAGAQTGGKIALWTEITPPGGRLLPHYHLNEDEFFLV